MAYSTSSHLTEVVVLLLSIGTEIDMQTTNVTSGSLNAINKYSMAMHL